MVGDYELLYLIHQQNEVALNLLIKRYRPILTSQTKMLVTKQGYCDDEDGCQEAWIGFLNAIENYRDDKEAGFKHFAKLCAEREVRSMLRKHRSLTNMANYHAVSLDQLIKDSEAIYVVDSIQNNIPHFEPEWKADYNYYQELILDIYQDLNPKEKNVLGLYQQGFSYKQIAMKCELKVKEVDYILQRIKKAMRSVFD